MGKYPQSNHDHQRNNGFGATYPLLIGNVRSNTHWRLGDDTLWRTVAFEFLQWFEKYDGKIHLASREEPSIPLAPGA